MNNNHNHKIRISRRHLRIIQGLKRHKAHPLLHHLHKKHKISRKTLFYIKEYGPHTHVSKTIIRESIKILLLASVISSFGGMALESIKAAFIAIMPLVILLPVLNDMIGDYGTIISSRFSTMLHEGKINSHIFSNKEIRKLFAEIFLVAMTTTFLSCVASLIISAKHAFSWITSLKVFLIAFADVAILVSLLFMVAIIAGLYLYKKKEDPNNFLIPITTSIADFGNMIILTLLVILVF